MIIKKLKLMILKVMGNLKVLYSIEKIIEILIFPFHIIEVKIN